MSQYEIGVLSGCFTIFLNYCMGKPGGDFSPHEIFSFYTIWLSKRRLKQLGLYTTYQKQFGFETAKSDHELIEKRNDAAMILYNAAESFFTWERAVGMCSICTGVWISLIFALTFTHDILQVIEIVVLSHITIRILNKIL